jgi:predicted alpha-1,2-mannosidase
MKGRLFYLRQVQAGIALFLSFIWLLPSCGENKIDSKVSFTSYVNPFTGTGFHGHVFLGANVPFGAVQLGPVNMSEGWDWCSGYHYSDSTIIGFSHTHLSGTGIGDLGDILVMPATGKVKVKKGNLNDYESGYYSLFDHEKERAKPGYYAVELKRYRIKAELTATERVGFHQYSFPRSDDAKIIIDLKEGIGWDRPIKTKIRQVNDTTIEGYRYSTGWAKDQQVFFTAIFSKPMTGFSIYEDSILMEGTEWQGAMGRCVANFNTTENEKIKVKVGLSPVSTENALANINAELPVWDFEMVVKNADNAWNKELGKIAITTADEKKLRTFYTALYHTMFAPALFNDHNGDYRGTDKKIYRGATFNNLTIFSLWDTYRAAHPLFTIFQEERVNDMINSMLAIYQQQGKLPVWHLVGNETNTMPGNSGIHVVTDAYLKGFRGFDTVLAWEAVRATAMVDERGMHFVKKNGYIPADSMVESAALGLEYAIADWGIAEMAKRMGKQEDFKYFSERAKNYRYYFDSTSKFMRGRLSEKEWRTPFSPIVARHMKDDFSEGNAWQYTWLVPHDVEGLMKLLGGEQPFIKKLDSLFVIKGDMGKEASNDITGLIGQYAHGNEPGHHIPYLYAFAGQPWKTAEKVRYIVDSLYSDKVDGLCGNEDVGQMSAWYVLSALGFYQVNPASAVYVFGSPSVDKAELRMANGAIFKIIALNNSDSNKYIQSIRLNGQDYERSYIHYRDIIKGGELQVTMGAKPSGTWGVAQRTRPSNNSPE